MKLRFTKTSSHNLQKNIKYINQIKPSRSLVMALSMYITTLLLLIAYNYLYEYHKQQDVKVANYSIVAFKVKLA